MISFLKETSEQTNKSINSNEEIIYFNFLDFIKIKQRGCLSNFGIYQVLFFISILNIKYLFIFI